jgi:hypothetical protein
MPLRIDLTGPDSPRRNRATVVGEELGQDKHAEWRKSPAATFRVNRTRGATGFLREDQKVNARANRTAPTVAQGDHDPRTSSESSAEEREEVASPSGIRLHPANQRFLLGPRKTVGRQADLHFVCALKRRREQSSVSGVQVVECTAQHRDASPMRPRPRGSGSRQLLEPPSGRPSCWRDAEDDVSRSDRSCPSRPRRILRWWSVSQ